uniref:Uncharacterized protein n=1 Tax=Chelonoidis abingdonii TaxID=106734 RepID=A0A8C0IY60_CHEAB
MSNHLKKSRRLLTFVTVVLRDVLLLSIPNPPSFPTDGIARLHFTNSTQDALANKTIKPLLNAFSQIPESENEKKCTLDQSFRVVLEEEIINQASCENVLAIISLAFNGVTDGICTPSTPFVLLGDVLDCLPLDQCDKIFTFVEKKCHYMEIKYILFSWEKLLAENVQ